MHHRSIFQAMSMQQRTENWYIGIIGHKKANNEVVRHLQGDQGQVGVPQVPILGHEDAIETPNLAKGLCACAMSLAFGVCHEFRDTFT